MKAYLCVYRHLRPPDRDLARTEEAASGNPALRRYLDAYGHGDSFYDWGDDPSFFAASEFLGDARNATWGVCRPDVRAALSTGDYVVFVCGKQPPRYARAWEYYFVSVATLGEGLSRETIWSDDRYSVYRRFFNVLARVDGSGLTQHEFVHRFHDNWRERARAAYWLFDANHTGLNLTSPLLLATYDGEPGQIERWHMSGDRVRDLHSMLLRGARPSRGLRSTNIWQPHPKLNLSNGYRTDGELRDLRTKLLELVEE
ncbi:MAG TPA: hypothetical protein VII01_09445 [Solirubrobacteraceae bacterium]